MNCNGLNFEFAGMKILKNLQKAVKKQFTSSIFYDKIT